MTIQNNWDEGNDRRETFYTFYSIKRVRDGILDRKIVCLQRRQEEAHGAQALIERASLLSLRSNPQSFSDIIAERIQSDVAHAVRKANCSFRRSRMALIVRTVSEFHPSDVSQWFELLNEFTGIMCGIDYLSDIRNCGIPMCRIPTQEELRSMARSLRSSGRTLPLTSIIEAFRPWFEPQRNGDNDKLVEKECHRLELAIREE